MDDYKVKCCICNRPTSHRTGVNLQMDVQINWPYPKWGNFLTGDRNKGISIICDSCSKKSNLDFTTVHSVIEWDEVTKKVTYHPLSWIKNLNGRSIPTLVNK